MEGETPITGDLAEIASVAGRDAAERIGDELEGRVLIIPSRMKYDGPLHGILEEIAEVVGVDLMIRFSNAFGGARVSFPSASLLAKNRQGAATAVERVVGREATVKLAQRFDRMLVYIPKHPTASVYEARRRRVRELIMQGLSVSLISQETGISERSVYLHRSQMKKGTPLGNTTQYAITTQKARRLLMDGMAVRDVAEELGATLPRVRAIQSMLRRRGTNV